MTTPTYSRGQVVFAIPPETNDVTVPITKTKSGKIGKHPIVILSADASAQTITGVMLQSFNGAADLTVIGLDATLYKWFLPVSPADIESIHDPIHAQLGSMGKPQLVNLKDVLTIAEEKIARSRFSVARSSTK